MKVSDEVRFMIGLFTIVVIIAFTMTIRSLKDDNKRLKHELDYFEQTYQQKQGFTALWAGSGKDGVNYELRSFDAGKTWYAVHRGTNDTLIIDGLAEVVYPGLMKHLENWDNIVAYAEKNGPITLTKPDDFKILSDNGFTITTNK